MSVCRPPCFRTAEQHHYAVQLQADGREANRVQVKLGRSSVQTIEIVEGLQVGDQVILSDMTAQDAHNRINLIKCCKYWGKDINEVQMNLCFAPDGVTKVFVTDEVETHALAGIHMVK